MPKQMLPATPPRRISSVSARKRHRDLVELLDDEGVGEPALEGHEVVGRDGPSDSDTHVGKPTPTPPDCDIRRYLTLHSTGHHSEPMPAHDPQMLKGVLGLLLLSALSTGDHYGYGLVTQLRSAGFDDLAEGTVYPGLTRLESPGLLDSYLAAQRLRSCPQVLPAHRRRPAPSSAHRQTASSSLVRSVETATAAVGAPHSRQGNPHDRPGPDFASRTPSSATTSGSRCAGCAARGRRELRRELRVQPRRGQRGRGAPPGPSSASAHPGGSPTPPRTPTPPAPWSPGGDLGVGGLRGSSRFAWASSRAIGVHRGGGGQRGGGTHRAGGVGLPLVRRRASPRAWRRTVEGSRPGPAAWARGSSGCRSSCSCLVAQPWRVLRRRQPGRLRRDVNRPGRVTVPEPLPYDPVGARGHRAPLSAAGRARQSARHGHPPLAGRRLHGPFWAIVFNCTLKRSPEKSHTQGLIDVSTAIMEKHGVDVEVLRVVDHDIATGVYPDMTEHGWPRRRVARHLGAGAGQRHPRHRRPDLARRQLQRHEAGHRAALRHERADQRAGPVHLLRQGRRDDHHRQRGRHQALRVQHPLQPPAPRLHHPAERQRRLDRRGRAGPVLPRRRAAAARRTSSPSATRRS